ncbi:VOC family protein [Algoriphagus resistens]|uniref:VOC family protein n=1 Tax=Algoriphagus resistens TaxID=1750590 RepID=UPI000716A8FD|nr:VOC family protein [Algoriphagus resistens]
MNIHSYLNFNGQAEEAMHFYQKTLGGEFEGGFNYFSEIPGMDQLSEDEKKRVMHVTLMLSDQVKIMASDIMPSMGHKLIVGNHNYISLMPDSIEKGREYFQGLSEGGTVEMPYEKAFWGAYFGSFIDKYGNGWMINYTLKEGEE